VQQTGISGTAISNQSPNLNTNYTLSANSTAAINTGNNNFYNNLTNPPATDLFGNQRIQNTTIDIGAYEFTSITPTAGIVYVNKNIAAGGNGSSWNTAVKELSDALKAAKTDNTITQIWVAKGTYKPLYTPKDGATYGTNQGQDNAFALMNGVKIYGGFAGTNETNISQRDFTQNETILSGDIDNDDVGGTINGNNAFHVVVSVQNNNTAVLDGFTISGGNANGSNFPFIGGQSVDGSYGGGIAVIYLSNPVISNCIIKNNSAINGGGGIYTKISSAPNISNCTISNNTATYGAGMYNNGSSPIVTNSVITGNTAINTGNGGGVSNTGSSAQPLFVNTAIIGNTATNLGGAFYNENSSAPTMTNCTIAGNTSNSGVIYSFGTGTSPKVYNSIIWSNSATISNIGGGSITVSNSIVPGGYQGTGNSGNNPNLNTNYTLSATSTAAINAGNNTYYNNGVFNTQYPATDLSGNARIQNTTIDMGAYEFTTVVITPTAGIVFVNKSVTVSGDGSSWNTAVKELSDALKAAKTDNTIQQIWVAAGTYYPMYSPRDGANFTNETFDNAFLLVNGVKMYGGFNATNPENSINNRNITANPTILSGDLDGDNTISANDAHHVVLGVNAGNTTAIDGFIIERGFASSLVGNNITVTSVTISQENGAGMYLTNNSSPIISNCIIRNNTTDIYGGGIFNLNTSSPVISNCTIDNNTAGSGGAGIYNGGNSSPSINNSIIRNNITNNLGGGISNNGTANPKITNCTITGNSAVNGGGIANVFSITSLLITGCNISGNTATTGGGIYNFDASPIITNSTIAKNTNSGIANGGSTPTINNCIVWANGTAGISDAGGSNSTVSNSIVQGGFSGTNISSQNPQFTDENNGIFTLTSTSPAVDAGDNGYYQNLSVTPPTTDLAGNTRIQGTKIDLGAYESSFSGTPSQGVIIYVKKGGAGTMDGLSWANAAPELADVLVQAKIFGGISEIWVAKGTYYPMYSPEDGANFGTNQGRDNAFLLVSNVKLYGGFDPDNGKDDMTNRDSLASNNGTILSGDMDGNNVLDNGNAYHVVISARNVNGAELNGFTIKGGNATGANDISINNQSIYENFGGGIYNINSYAKINACSITDNYAEYAGGIYIYDYDQLHPFITNSIINNNTAINGGGTLNESSAQVFTNVLFTNNTATNGGAAYIVLSTSSFVNCTMYGNSSGIFNDAGGAGEIYNSILWNNNNDFPTGGATTYNSIVQSTNGYANGGNTSNANPNLNTTDYTLSANSTAAINTGNNTNYLSTFSTTDLAGNTRIQNTTIDMGAYESPYNNAVTITPNSSGIVFVNKSVSGGNGSGDSWTNAVAEVADALKAAKIQNDISPQTIQQIWVADGIYYPKYSPRDGANFADEGRDNTFLLVKDVKLYGGFSGNGTETDISQRDTLGYNTNLNGNEYNYHVVVSSGDAGDAVLDGFYISKGNGTGTSGSIPVNGISVIRKLFGGGVYNNNSSPTISNCRIANNTSTDAGAGIYNENNSSATINNCSIDFNISNYQGGGIYNVNSSLKISNSNIDNNQAASSGGNIYNIGTSLFITNSHITNSNNEGVYNILGGKVTLVNTLLKGNQGTALFNELNISNPNTATLTNCTVTQNNFGIINKQNLTVSNSILFGNGNGSISNTGTANISNSIVDGGYAGTNVLNEDPHFTNPGGNDFTLQSISGAINTGDNNLYTGTNLNIHTDKDLAGNLRLQQSLIDMGAYESPYTGTLAVSDINKNNINVYPNPTDGELRITKQGSAQANYKLQNNSIIQLFDMSGRKMNAKNISNAGNVTKLDISHLPSGTYFLKINNETVKVIKR
jgi:hypothetical protein